MKRFLLIPVALVLFAAGCALTPAEVDRYKADRDALVAVLPQLDAEIAKLPAGDPVRKNYEKQRQAVARAIAIASGLIDTADTGGLSPELVKAVSDVPVVGKYASLALLLGSVGYGIYQRRQKAKLDKALTQVVQSVETAFPNKTSDEKLAMAAVQDEDTRKAVNARKDFTPAVELVLNEDEPAVAGVVTK
jgi:predicted lysophospholipase L1 biosynthesis ABC-type transport system permease subunit